MQQPWVNFALLAAGIVTVMFIAPATRKDLQIVAGGELVLLALVRFLLNKQSRWFFWGLLLVGVTLPLAAGATAPIYYSRSEGWFSRPFFEMMGIGMLVGVPLIAVAVWGLSWLRRGQGAQRPEPRWFHWFEWFFEAAVWVMVFTLSQGQWTDFAVFSVAFGGVCFALGIFLLMVVRLGLGSRGVSVMFGVTGLVCLLTSVVLVATQDGRVSVEEAAAPAVIGVVFLVIAGAIRLFGVRRTTETVM